MPATALAVPTLSQIQAWSSDHLESAATQWERTADTWEHAFAAVHRETPTPGGTTWTGAGADAAVLRTGADRLVAAGAAESLHAAAKAARYGAGEITGARQLALAAVAAAQAAGFDVRDDLSVTSRQPVPATLQAAVQAQAQTHAAAIRSQAAALLAVDQQVAGDVSAAIAGVSGAQFDDTPVSPTDEQQKKDPTIQLVDNHTFKDSPADDSPIPPGGWSSDPVMEDAQRIAYGHAWDQHRDQFPGMTRDDLANLIHDMMTGNPKTDPDLHVGSGERNTTVMYRDGILVIHDPNTRDGGTIFKPDNGFQDFLRYTAPIINAPPNIGTPDPHAPTRRPGADQPAARRHAAAEPADTAAATVAGRPVAARLPDRAAGPAARSHPGPLGRPRHAVGARRTHHRRQRRRRTAAAAGRPGRPRVERHRRRRRGHPQRNRLRRRLSRPSLRPAGMTGPASDAEWRRLAAATSLAELDRPPRRRPHRDGHRRHRMAGQPFDA